MVVLGKYWGHMRSTLAGLVQDWDLTVSIRMASDLNWNQMGSAWVGLGQDLEHMGSAGMKIGTTWGWLGSGWVEIEKNEFTSALSWFALGSLGFLHVLLGYPLSFVSVASASLLVRFGFPWVPLWSARVALRFHCSRLCFPLGSGCDPSSS